MTSSSSPLGNYNAAAVAFEQKVGLRMSLETLIPELKNVQRLFAKAIQALQSNNQKAAETLTEQNAQFLAKFTPLIDQHLKGLSAKRDALETQIAQSIPSQAVAASKTATVAKTVIKVSCKVPFGHELRIFGDGEGLNWTTGSPLTKLEDGTLTYVANGPLSYKFKFDGQWENYNGNRTAKASETVQIEKPEIAMPVVPVIVDCQLKATEKLFMRGSGPGMSWTKGIELRQVAGKHVLELPTAQEFDFKLLVNDSAWERTEGDKNWHVTAGQTLNITPSFGGSGVSRIGAGGTRRADDLQRHAAPALQAKSRVDDTNAIFSFE